MTALAQAREPFQFFSQVQLKEMTGLKASNLPQLVSHLKEVPGSVIYHHTHHFLQQHQYLSPEPPNDFAYWVTEILQEKKLGEKLAGINTCEFNTIRQLREKIIATLEAYLESADRKLREAHEGEEFYFLKSVSFVFPTTHIARNLAEFLAALKQVTILSIYYHMFEARLRLEKGSNDFSLWLESSLDEKELARKIARLDPYTHTMEGLRKRVAQMIELKLAKEGALDVRKEGEDVSA